MDDALAMLRKRGLVQGIINEEAWSESGVRMTSAYAGFDATAKSLHVGHLVVFRVLHVLQDAGLPVIGLIGEGTARVGDPSFRTTERQMLDKKSVEDNALPIRKTVETLLSGQNARVVSNAEWLSDLNALDFLTETGKHFTMSRMLSFESVKARLGAGLTFLEFAYMLLQAKDFLELRERFGCDVQVGGSDQWANILCGVDLIRKTRSEVAFGITAPLLTRSDGRKMGKSEGRAVWLDPSMTSDFDFWQFWRNTPDEDVSRFLKIFTDIPEDECERFGGLRGVELNVGKIALADSVTTLVRGEGAAKASFLAATSSEGATEGLPKVTLDGEVALAKALLTAGLAQSAKSAKRFVSEGVRVNDDRVTDPARVIRAGDVLGFGKRKVLMVAPS